MIGRSQTGERRFARASLSVLLLASLFLVSCQQLEKPEPEAFYSETAPPRAQEFRWSNGRMPQSFDPMRAAAPPDTDIVRAIYDGLTEIDPKSLEAVPSIAESWESAEEGREWTFELRQDALWTNGEPVKAADFVRSWKRLAENGEKVAHSLHLSNIVGFSDLSGTPEKGAEAVSDPSRKPVAGDIPKLQPEGRQRTGQPDKSPHNDSSALAATPREFGAVAVDDFTLRVVLIEPDAQFPRLAAHPVLRPVYGDGAAYERNPLDASAITNGAFRVESVEKEKVSLVKSDTYYAKETVKLQSIRLVLAKDADAALADYRRGEVDAVTNTEFEPLALKILTPYVDFQRTSHSALNFYEFNRQNPPFNDRRVREALSIAIDRKRIAEDITDGAAVPAYGFLPFGDGKGPVKIEENAARAKELLQRAGFPNGEDFPVVRLVVNRNDLQQKVAREVASMWKAGLNVDTEIVVKEMTELEDVRASGEYDLMRRGAVLPTSDETANMLAIFRPPSGESTAGDAEQQQKTDLGKNTPVKIPKMPTPLPDPNLGLKDFDGLPPAPRDELTVEIAGAFDPILTEDEAVAEMPAIPLYFPTSYSLVKPYVFGFDINSLDAPLLKSVSINSAWRPKVRSGP